MRFWPLPHPLYGNFFLNWFTLISRMTKIDLPGAEFSPWAENLEAWVHVPLNGWFLLRQPIKTENVTQPHKTKCIKYNHIFMAFSLNIRGLQSFTASYYMNSFEIHSAVHLKWKKNILSWSTESVYRLFGLSTIEHSIETLYSGSNHVPEKAQL